MLRASVRRFRGFSLLEVMVSLAILSVGLVLLLQVQARSIQLAQEAREMTVATMLARGKILDCEADLLKKGFSVGDYKENGAFDEEGYPTFYWECHGYKPDMPIGETGDPSGALAGLGMGGGTEDAAAQQPGADQGMQFIAPIMQQMATVLGDSIRELHVIVRWGEGADMQEMSVTTHIIDKTAVNTIAGVIQQQSQAMQNLTGGNRSSQEQGPPGQQAPNVPGLNTGSPNLPRGVK
jgi:general secretion pathway protein I